MSCLWDLGSCDANAVSQRLATTYGRTYGQKTASVLLGRLLKKGYVTYTPGKAPTGGRRPHIYLATVSRSYSFQIIFNHFLEGYQLSRADFERIWGWVLFREDFRKKHEAREAEAAKAAEAAEAESKP